MLSHFDPRRLELSEAVGDVPAHWPQRQEQQEGGTVYIASVIISCAAVAVALVWPVSSWAQTIYRSTMPDGRVIFGDKPVSGAARVETIDTSGPPPNVVPLGSRNEEALQQRELRHQQEAAHQADMREAEQALRAAKAAQVAGKEPLPGERRGNVGGGSRLTEEYWERQKALKTSVAEARKRLDAVRAGR